MALRVGTTHPITAAISNTTTVPPNTTGSLGDTPTNNDRNTRVAPNASNNPIANPGASGRIPCRNTSPTMSPRVAPSAIRNPISCVRWLTACRITAYKPIAADTGNTTTSTCC